MKTRFNRAASTIIAAAVVGPAAHADGLDAVWRFHPTPARTAETAGPFEIPPASRVVSGDPSRGGGAVFGGPDDILVLRAPIGTDVALLPARAMTVAAWMSIDTPQRWGGVIGCVQDNGGYEQGWVLGFDETNFTFALATAGADDGDGAMTYVTTDTPWSAGRWTHVAAVYDGAVAAIYVDGVRAALSRAQSGPILYDTEAPFVIGAYQDDNEQHPFDGRLREIRLLDRAASAEEIRNWWAENAALNDLPPSVDTPLEWLVTPYLTWPAHDAISILGETTRPTVARVEVWGETGTPRINVQADAPAMLHEFRVAGLDPNRKYFYRMTAAPPDADPDLTPLTTPTLAFRTAATPDHAFTFVAIGDTQAQPEVVRRIAAEAYEHRPNLVIHAGDLVSTGSNKQHWTGHFFPNMQPLISRSPLMPVLGNHEQDARHYYRYMSLPEPEMWYAFEYGPAEFFMIDGNRQLDAASEQLAWLEQALSSSTATWKFAVLHQPPWTSDADDYGSTRDGPSTRGDMNVRNIVALLEEHQVDICFSGHVHDYERTFPIRRERAAAYEDGGVIYVTTAGGGGHLEDFDAVNTWFGHKKQRRHHFVYVAINGGHLEFQAVDEYGELFDSMELRKIDGRRETGGPVRR